jgi:hypothetical protein
MEIKILERNNIFLVGKIKIKRKWLFGKPYEKFECMYKGLYSPAHFDTIDEAKTFVKKITKPDVYHKIN